MICSAAVNHTKTSMMPQALLQASPMKRKLAPIAAPTCT